MIELMPHQEECVKFHHYHEYSLNGSGMGCISGSATVKINRGGCSKSMTLESLYKSFISKRLGKVHQPYIRGWDGERVRLLILKKVIFSGVKKTFTVTSVDGMSIRATADHEFLTNVGWLRLDQLDVAKHLLATDLTTKHTKKEVKNSRPKMRYNLRHVGIYHPYGQKMTSKPHAKRIEIHRAVKEAQINDMDLESFLAATRDEKSAKKLKYIDPKKYHVHHINRDHRDHRPENLEILSAEDHFKEHSIHSYRNFGHGEITWKEMKSIVPHKEEPVYDLKVEAPFHNFSCNRFIVHNCGKSIIALELMRLTGLRGLVVGPTFLRDNWIKEGNKFGFTNFEYIPVTQIHKYKAEDLQEFGVWIADEIHYLKNPSARRTISYYGLLKKVRPQYWLGLSGTIVKNKIFDLWVPLAICSQAPNDTNGKRLEGDLQRYRGFSSYFCHTDIVRVRNARIEKYGKVKDDKIPELKSLLDKKYIRFTLDQVVKDMPELIEKEIELEGLTPIDGLEEQFNSYMEGSKVDPTAKATSALLKVPHTVEYMDSFIESEEPAIVFTDHRESAARLASALKCPCVTGATPAATRAQYVEEFQLGKHDFLVATIGALAVGVTLTRARHVVFNDLSWTHADNLQARARIHRIGQKNVCFAHYIYASDTDSYIKRAVEAKAKSNLKVLGHE
jgi:hypothetical protein